MGIDELDIGKPRDELVDVNIKVIMQYTFVCAVNADFSNVERPKMGLIAIGNMLTLTLLEFPG